MSSLALGLVVYHEPEWLVKTALLNAISVYKQYLHEIIIIHKEEPTFSYSEFENVSVFVYPNNKKPQYLNMQFLYQKYLEISNALYFVTIDADTIVLKWDQEFYQLAGRFISYSKNALMRYWEALNPLYQQIFINFYHKGSIHSIQGGWSMRSRTIVEIMKKFLFQILSFGNENLIHFLKEFHQVVVLNIDQLRSSLKNILIL